MQEASFTRRKTLFRRLRAAGLSGALARLQAAVFGGGVCPAVGGFIQAHARQAQRLAVLGAKARGEQGEGVAGEVFDGGGEIEHDGFVAGQRLQEVAHDAVFLPDEEGVVPVGDEVFVGDGFDERKIQHHAVARVAGAVERFAFQREFQRVAVAVQVAALAGVFGDAVACVKFKAAGDAHDGKGVISRLPARR